MTRVPYVVTGAFVKSKRKKKTKSDLISFSLYTVFLRLLDMFVMKHLQLTEKKSFDFEQELTGRGRNC